MPWCYVGVWLNTDVSPSPCVLQENGLSHVPGPTAVRSSPAPTSWPATTAPTRGRRSSGVRSVTSASCAATTWSSTPAVIPTSSLPCWDATRAPPPVPAPPCTIRMVWVSWQEHTRSRWFQVNQLQSEPLISILALLCCTQKCAQKIHVHKQTHTHTAGGGGGGVASSLHPHGWVMWPLSTCSTKLGLGIENVPNL